MSHFFEHLRMAFWRAFEHDAFGVAKAAAFSAILTLFPAVLVFASILSRSSSSELFVREIFRAGPYIAGRDQHHRAAIFLRSKPVKTKLLVTTSILPCGPPPAS